jgi:hypothetical protein
LWYRVVAVSPSRKSLAGAPSIVSLPSPPVIESSPVPADEAVLAVEPVSVSSPSPPMRFSTSAPIVSFSRPAVARDADRQREILRAIRVAGVSTPSPPVIASSPRPASITSLPAPPSTESSPLPVVIGIVAGSADDRRVDADGRIDRHVVIATRGVDADARDLRTAVKLKASPR